MKLIGNPDMIAVFDAVGVGQWFRYVTGLIEVGSAVLLFVPGMQLIGAALLGATMVGAILAHLFILGPSFVPALVLLPTHIVRGRREGFGYFQNNEGAR